MEEWRDIQGYEGSYQVSNFGRVKSLDRKVKCKGGSKRMSLGKVLRQHVAKNGYLKVELSKKGEYKTNYIHILVAIHFLAHKPNGHTIIVDHKDNDKLNNRMDNLQLISHRENLNKDKGTLSGVYFDKKRGNYQARIRFGGKRFFLGSYLTPEQAHNAYSRKLNEIWT